MSKLEKVSQYTALTDFFSKKLKKAILTGQVITAPASLGSEWVKQNLAIKNPPIKTTTS